MKLSHFIKKTLFAFCILSVYTATSQIVRGKVVDSNGEILPNVNVIEKEAVSNVVTDDNGEFSLNVSGLPTTLVISIVGYKTVEQEISSINVETITLSKKREGLDSFVFVGSYNHHRTAFDTPAPIDVIDIEALTSAGPQVSISEILNYASPSFTSVPQTISGGTDHIDPISLRNLGPDQVLVLINGKRRHVSSLVNINETIGKGSVGTDLNSIPSFAIKKIEILRDGASAQYGSDAIAGVINIVLKDKEGFEASLNSTGYLGQATNNHTGGIDGETFQVDANYGIKIGDKGGFLNLTGSMGSRQFAKRAGKAGYTGTVFNGANSIEWVGGNSGKGFDITKYGLNDIQFFAQGIQHFDLATKNAISNATSIEEIFGKDAGVNSVAGVLSTLSTTTLSDGVTVVSGITPIDYTDAELLKRSLTRQDFSMRIGPSQLRNAKFMANMDLPISDTFNLYAFGGLSFREGDAAEFYKTPNQASIHTGLYRGGFLPEIVSDISDKYFVFGLKGMIGDWDIDLSNVWGINIFDFTTRNSNNPTLLGRSPLTLNAGGFSFAENTSNLDLTCFYDNVLSGLSVTTGIEFKYENYLIFAGREESWATYGTDGNIWDGNPETQVVDIFGRARPGGMQGFTGFSPENRRDDVNNSYAVFADLELNITDKWMVSGAGRYENYSDFGTTISWKVASGLKLGKNINLRTSASTGFRAPSLHQLYFNNVSNNFVNGQLNKSGIFSDDSSIAKEAGVKRLKQEDSFNASFGLAAKIPSINLSLAIDAFFIGVEDRIILSGEIALPQNLVEEFGANQVRFFGNFIDTETKGIEAVINQKSEFGSKISLKNQLAASYIQTNRVDELGFPTNVGPNGVWSEQDEILLENAQPRFKGSLLNIVESNNWKVYLRNTYFGSVISPDRGAVVVGQFITDLSFGYNITNDFRLTVGANNILDALPNRNPTSLTSGNNFIYPRAISQFGIGGRYLFTRLNFKL